MENQHRVRKLKALRKYGKNQKAKKFKENRKNKLHEYAKGYLTEMFMINRYKKYERKISSLWGVKI